MFSSVVAGVGGDLKLDRLHWVEKVRMSMINGVFIYFNGCSTDFRIINSEIEVSY